MKVVKCPKGPLKLTTTTKTFWKWFRDEDRRRKGISLGVNDCTPKTPNQSVDPGLGHDSLLRHFSECGCKVTPLYSRTYGRYRTLCQRPTFSMSTGGSRYQSERRQSQGYPLVPDSYNSIKLSQK